MRTTGPQTMAGVRHDELADLDLPVGVMRGFALLARSAGLLGHLEEEADPIGMKIYLNVDRNIDYRPTAGSRAGMSERGYCDRSSDILARHGGKGGSEMTVTASPRTGQQGTIGDATRLKAAGGIAPWWYNWVDRHRVAGIALVGVIATQLGTYFGYVFPAAGLPPVPWPLYNGALGLLGAEFNTTGSFFVGQTLHYINGIVFAILYAVLFLPLMPFRNTRGGNLLSGIIYTIIMTIISIGFLVPYAYVPHQGYGFFSFYGPDGWKLPAAVLLWHLIYGFFLGTLYMVKNHEGYEAA